MYLVNIFDKFQLQTKGIMLLRLQPTVLILLVIQAICFAQTNKVIGISKQFPTGFMQTETIAQGESSLYYLGTTDLSYHYLTKIDTNEIIIWSKRFSGIDYYYKMCEIKVHDNAIYLLNSHATEVKYVLIKLDLNGNFLWSKLLQPQYVADNLSYHYPGIEITDNQIVISSSHLYGIDIFKLDHSGNEISISSFYTDSTVSKNPNFDIVIDDSGGLIGCAKAEADMSTYSLSSSGVTRWAKRFIEPNMHTQIKSMLEINNNQYLLCGFRTSISNFELHGFYAFIDSNGVFTDFRVFDHLSEIKNGVVMSDGNILLNAETFDWSDSLYYDVAIIINPSGEIIQSSKIGISTNIVYSYNSFTEINGTHYFEWSGNEFLKIKNYTDFTCLNTAGINMSYITIDPNVIPNSNFIMATSSATITNYLTINLYEEIMELDLVCQSFVGLEELKEFPIKIYPTILKSYEELNIEHDNTETLTYQIVDINGKILIENNLIDNKINVEYLSSGAYFIQFSTQGRIVHTSKFIITN